MTSKLDHIQENVNGYTVKNCPCAYGVINTPMYCLLNDIVPAYNTLCHDCTDCVIKQVIEECKWETSIDVDDRGDLAERILSFFDIEEINK